MTNHMTDEAYQIAARLLDGKYAISRYQTSAPYKIIKAYPDIYGTFRDALAAIRRHASRMRTTYGCFKIIYGLKRVTLITTAKQPDGSIRCYYKDPDGGNDVCL